MKRNHRPGNNVKRVSRTVWRMLEVWGERAILRFRKRCPRYFTMNWFIAIPQPGLRALVRSPAMVQYGFVRNRMGIWANHRATIVDPKDGQLKNQHLHTRRLNHIMLYFKRGWRPGKGGIPWISGLAKPGYSNTSWFRCREQTSQHPQWRRKTQWWWNFQWFDWASSKSVIVQPDCSKAVATTRRPPKWFCRIRITRKLLNS